MSCTGTQILLFYVLTNNALITYTSSKIALSMQCKALLSSSSSSSSDEDSESSQEEEEEEEGERGSSHQKGSGHTIELDQSGQKLRHKHKPLKR